MAFSYALSKILPLLVSPLGIALFLLILCLITRRRFPVFISGFLLCFFSLGLVSQSLWRLVEAPWQRRSAFQAPDADVIVVLSGGRHPAPGIDRSAEWE